MHKNILNLQKNYNAYNSDDDDNKDESLVSEDDGSNDADSDNCKY